MAVHDPTPVEHRIFSVLVENRSGVLSHVVGLFSARGFNIDSLAVGETEDPTLSRITLVAAGDQKTLEQIKKQLNKLIDVVKIQDIQEEDLLEREMVLVKIKNTDANKKSIESLKSHYQVRVIDENPKLLTLECAESRKNTKKIMEVLKGIGIVELAQTGVVALSKKITKD